MADFALVVIVGCLTLMAWCIYNLFRNEWVGRRRQELVHWHFKQPDWQRDFDETYGTYGAWLYRRPFCWNPAKLAGLSEWVA